MVSLCMCVRARINRVQCIVFPHMFCSPFAGAQCSLRLANYLVQQIPAAFFLQRLSDVCRCFSVDLQWLHRVRSSLCAFTLSLPFGLCLESSRTNVNEPKVYLLCDWVDMVCGGYFKTMIICYGVFPITLAFTQFTFSHAKRFTVQFHM